MVPHRRAALEIVTVLAITLVPGCNNKRKSLLCKTNHEVLLQACRELLKQAAKGELEPRWYEFRRGPRLPAVSRFPKAILDLAPTRVIIHPEGYLTIEMAGGFDHFGVQAYPVDFKEPFAGFTRGHRKLIDGLWYYDEDYNYDSEYDKKVDAWIEKAEGRNGR